LVPSTTHTGRPSTSAESANDPANNPRNRAMSIDPSLRASHVLGQRRRNTVDKLCRTNVLRCGGVSIASSSSNKLS
jgi:hypothetical protein